MIGHYSAFHFSPGRGASMGVSKTSLFETKAHMEIEKIREKLQVQSSGSKTRLKRILTINLKYSTIRDFETLKVRSK